MAREKRAGILPNRGAGSKRKLNESFAQLSQTIHSFSTGDFSLASRKNFEFSFAHTSELKKNFSALFTRSGPLLVRPCEFIYAQWVRSKKNALRLDENRAGLEPCAIPGGGAIKTHE